MGRSVLVEKFPLPERVEVAPNARQVCFVHLSAGPPAWGPIRPPGTNVYDVIVEYPERFRSHFVIKLYMRYRQSCYDFKTEKR